MLVAVGVISYLLPLTSYLFSSCAKMGSPDGGWYDDDPPKVVRSVPDDQSVNVKSKKVTIYFDEFIKLEDATKKSSSRPRNWRWQRSRPQARRWLWNCKTR